MGRKLARYRDGQYAKFQLLTINNVDDYRKMLEINKEILPYHLRYDDDFVQKRELKYHLVTVGKQKHLIMYDDDFLFKVRDALKFYMDATFAICPCIPGVKQFLTIMVQKYNTVSQSITKVNN